jgi:hypothetical protein
MEQELKSEGIDIHKVVQEAVEEYARKAAEAKEPAVKAELAEERRRREQLERRLNELVEENDRNRAMAEQAERFASIKSELQQLGVRKVDLAFRVVKDEVVRGEDGQLYGRREQGLIALKDHLAKFISENPEFLPARMAGGSGAAGANRPESEAGSIDLSKIRPGMSAEEKERTRREIARLAGKDFGGWS